jgi:hypothetical protein
VLDAAGCWRVKRASDDITKTSTTTIAAASATFTTMRTVNGTVGLQHLLRNAGDRAASTKASRRGSDDANACPRELLAIRRKRSARAASPATNRTRSSPL